MEIRTEKDYVIHSGRAHGPILGGNLTTLCHLIGTGFFPKLKGKILLLEDRGEAPYRIDRMLTQMTLAGCFYGLAGLILGSFEECGEIDEVYRVFMERFKDFGIPVLGGFPVGHGRVNMTVPMGVDAVLDTNRHALLFQIPATAAAPKTVRRPGR